MVKAKKHLGQHFLKDQEIAQKITNSINQDVNQIIEVGPGMGVLTKYLVQNPWQIEAYEIDSESVNYLNQNLDAPNLTILEQDFLKADLKSKDQKEIAIIGNFPYNISTQIVFKILENKENIGQMVGMFQKEVAERICAKEGNKTYGITSVLTQAFYETEYLFTVGENSFNPPPKVKSGVIRLTKKTNNEDIDYNKLRKIVKTAFNQRRKKLSNALKSLGIPEHLKGHKFLNLRAEQLSVADFIALTKNWDE